MKYNVYDTKGIKKEEIELSAKTWNTEPHKQAIYDLTISQLAGLRQGTKKTKDRSEVSGGGRKPWKQKGTGNARQGSIRSPQWRGGGIVFGPTPEVNYKKKVNKKVAKLAIKSVLSLKAKEKKLTIIDEIKLDKLSTKAMLEIIKSLKITDKKILFIVEKFDEKLYRSIQNIPNVWAITANEINMLDIMHANTIVLTKPTLPIIEGAY